MKPTEFTITRSKWLRNNKDHRNYGVGELRNNEGRMCCLGFACKASGVSDRQIQGKAMPHLLSLKARKLVKWLFPEFGRHYAGKYELNCIRNLSTLNDDESVTDETRERRIKETFKELGVKVRFED